MEHPLPTKAPSAKPPKKAKPAKPAVVLAADEAPPPTEHLTDDSLAAAPDCTEDAVVAAAPLPHDAESTEPPQASVTPSDEVLHANTEGVPPAESEPPRAAEFDLQAALTALAARKKQKLAAA